MMSTKQAKFTGSAWFGRGEVEALDFEIGPQVTSHLAASAQARATFALARWLVSALVALCPLTAAAQGVSSAIRGDAGLKSGSQAPAGLYVTTLVYNYNTDTLKANDGRELKPNLGVSQTLTAIAATYVSEKKILGANYSASAVMVPLTNVAIDTPRLDQSTGWGATDIYFQLAQLGWHFKQVDLVAGYGLFVPTGRFDPEADDNTGLGQWSHELTFGFTLYPVASKKVHLATLAAYNIQSEKRGTNQTVGDTLTLEGGAGVDFRKGVITTGLAYYAQWKMTEDKNLSLLPAFRGKHRYLGLGPEVTGLLPFCKKVPMIGTFRYLFETGNRVATQGNSLFFALTFVVAAGH